MTTATLTLADFLLARIAEDEAVARAVRARDPWHSEQKDFTLVIDTEAEDSMGWEFGGGSGVWGCDDPDDDCDLYRSAAFVEAEHIARHDPARVLAECEAKRRIVESAQFAEDTPSIHDDARVYMRNVLTLLAAVYADHPDYRSEWAPS